MSDLGGWIWEYDPDEEQVIKGVAVEVAMEAEALAAELVTLASLGVDVTDMGNGPAHGGPGGVRIFDLPSGGFMHVLPLPRAQLVEIVRITPPVHLL